MSPMPSSTRVCEGASEMSADPQLGLTDIASGQDLPSPGAGLLVAEADRATPAMRRPSGGGVRGRWRQFSSASKAGTVVFALLLLSGLLAPLISPDDPLAQN